MISSDSLIRRLILILLVFTSYSFAGEKKIVYLEPVGKYTEVDFKYYIKQQKDIKDVFFGRFFIYCYGLV